MFKNWKHILLLALPSVLSFATSTLTGTVNLIMVGHLGALIIAIVGVTNIIMYNAFAIFSGIGHTVNYLVAQNYGAGDMKKGIERTYLALAMSVIFGVIIFLVGLFFSDTILQLTGGSDELVVAGEQYLQIRFYAMAFGIVNFVFHGFLRGVGDTKTSMVLSMISSVTMVVLTYALTFGALGFPELGLKGAGIAVLAGEIIGLLGGAYVFLVRMHAKYNTRSGMKLNIAEAKLILAESGKLGIQEFSMSVTMFIFTVFVARLGTHALAANEVSLSIMSLGFMPAFAFGSTATILVGQEIGKNNPHAARRAGTDTAIIGTLFLIILGTIEFIWAGPIAHLYTDDPQVFELAAYLITISAYLQIFDGLLNYYAGGLRGIGDTTFLLRVSAILSWFLFVPLAYLFIFVLEWGSLGAWLSLYIFLTAFGLSVMIRYYKTDWLSVQIKEAAHG